MAIKKDIFNNYVKNRQSNDLDNALNRKRKFTHNKVFQLSHEEDESDTSNASQTLVKDTSNASQMIVNLTIDNLSGLQLEIIKFMLNHLENKSLRTTIKIKTAMLISALNSSKSMVEQGVYRLKKKGYIDLYKRKNGRGGWCQYKLQKGIILENNSNQSNLRELQESPLYNSNITTTIKNKVREIDQIKRHIPDEKDTLIAEMQKQIAELQKEQIQPKQIVSHQKEGVDVNQYDLSYVDYSPLEPFGFNKKHLEKIIDANETLEDKKKLTKEQVEESIEHYAWALENHMDELTEKYSGSFKRSKFIIFLGVLKKGRLWTEDNYRSAEEIALEEQIKSNKKRLERVTRLKEEAFDTAYALWKSEITPSLYDEIRSMLPSSYSRLNDDSKMVINAFKKYFQENVYRE